MAASWEDSMSRTSVLGVRAASALLLALSLPISAQSPETTAAATPPAAPQSASQSAPQSEPLPIPPNDPSTLTSEIMPRASRSLLLDVTRTAAGFYVVGERGHILSSTDGKTWTQLTVPTRSTLTAIATADGQLWAAGHDGVIVHSADEGQTWAAQRRDPFQLAPQEDPADHDPQQGSPILDILFIDANTGIAIGANSLMLTTDNGGVTWTAKQALPKTAAPTTAPVADAAGVFSQDQLTLGEETDPHFNSIARTGSGALVIVGERGTFLRSRDAGATWQKAAFPYAGSMFGVLSWDGDHILAFGLRGNIYESTDLGDSWHKLDSGITSSLIGGQALPNGGAILVGSNGVVLTRKDAASPFELHNYQNAAGETPVLANTLDAGNGQFLLLGDKGVDLYQPK
jgi:photosystem II stability/assembly factor-like uncharacterized protein